MVACSYRFGFETSFGSYCLKKSKSFTCLTSPSTRPEVAQSEQNLVASKRIDEPDFDRRLTAFWKIYTEPSHALPGCRSFTICSKIRSSYGLTVLRIPCDILSILLLPLRLHLNMRCLRVLFSGLKNGLRSKSEMVGVTAYSVEQCQQIRCLDSDWFAFTTHSMGYNQLFDCTLPVEAPYQHQIHGAHIFLSNILGLINKKEGEQTHTLFGWDDDDIKCVVDC